MISAASVPIFIGLCTIAIALFVRDNKLGSSALAVTPDLIQMGASIGIGSILTAILLARRSTIAAAPFVLCAAMLVAVDILAVEALPHAEPFKPVPQLATIIGSQRQSGDVVAIQSFRGANALVFYTQPHVYALAPPGASKSDEGVPARSVLCTHDRIWQTSCVRPDVWTNAHADRLARHRRTVPHRRSRVPWRLKPAASS